MRPLSNQLTCNGCRDARSVRPSPLKRDVYPTIVKTTNAVTFDTTDAQIVRPYNGYTSPLIALTSNLYSSPRQKIGKRQGGKKKFFGLMI